MDLHETTDTHNSEIDPANAVREDVTVQTDPIPDGFYLVRRSLRSSDALIAADRRVTNFAEPDEYAGIIGMPLQQPRVIN